jgi:hypothetical protein
MAHEQRLDKSMIARALILAARCACLMTQRPNPGQPETVPWSGTVLISIKKNWEAQYIGSGYCRMNRAVDLGRVAKIARSMPVEVQPMSPCASGDIPSSVVGEVLLTAHRHLDRGEFAIRRPNAIISAASNRQKTTDRWKSAAPTTRDGDPQPTRSINWCRRWLRGFRNRRGSSLSGSTSRTTLLW